MKHYPGLTNLLTEQDKITKKRFVTKQWCHWATTLMFNIKYMKTEYGKRLSLKELHSYIFSFIVYGYWFEK